MNFIIQKILKLSVKIREYTSPKIYWLVRKLKYKNIELKDIWSEIKNYSLRDFSDYINKYKYKPDFFYGAVDSTIQEKNFFFYDKLKNWRDCDDFAQMYYWWAIENNKTPHMYIIIDGINIFSAHVITIIEIDERRFMLCNYSYIKEYETIEKAINEFRITPLTVHGKYSNLIFEKIK